MNDENQRAFIFKLAKKSEIGNSGIKSGLGTTFRVVYYRLVYSPSCGTSTTENAFRLIAFASGEVGRDGDLANHEKSGIHHRRLERDRL
jgi:hypothetical protein